eukprot:Colp12_sorted_trinity150504_noHs@21320
MGFLFRYFRHGGGVFGLSCYQKKMLDSQQERGARMRSVGVLCAKYTSLHEHKEFLEAQVSRILEQPGQYEPLKEYFILRQDKVETPEVPTSTEAALLQTSPDQLSKLKITHPAGCFKQFVQYFGPHVFVLWKLMLLRKRIVFLSPPPMGVVCYRVYCSCLLAEHTIPYLYENGCNPLFYVNLTDLPVLETETNYAACTSERILQSKERIYDVIVDNQRITSKPALAPLLKANSMDEARLEAMMQHTRRYERQGRRVSIQASDDDDKTLIRYFTDLNNNLFRRLLDFSSQAGRAIDAQTMLSWGLHPSDDQWFLTELIKLLNVEVQVDPPPCMPCLPCVGLC